MDRPSKLVLIAAVILFAVKTAPAAYQPTTLELGTAAPDFNLPAVDGKNYSLANFTDAKVLVVIFTCNHCPTAQAYEERIKKLAADYKDKGVAVVAISSNDPCALRIDEMAWSDVGDSLEDMKIRAKDKAFNFPYLYDGDTQTVAKAYGPVTTPHTFIFDKERKLRFVGRIDDSEWKEKPDAVRDARNALDALLAGKKPPVEQTKTFGCSIKWSDKRDSVKQERQELEKEKVTLEVIGVNEIKKIIKNDTKKLVLINVWATWCGPCRVEMPEIVMLYWIYRNRKVPEFEVITISADPPKIKDTVLEFLKQYHASTKNYLFEGKDVYALIEAVDPTWPGGIPYTMLIEPGGKVAYRQLGQIDPLEARRAILAYCSNFLPWWVKE